MIPLSILLLHMCHPHRIRRRSHHCSYPNRILEVLEKKSALPNKSLATDENKHRLCFMAWTGTNEDLDQSMDQCQKLGEVGIGAKIRGSGEAHEEVRRKNGEIKSMGGRKLRQRADHAACSAESPLSFDTRCALGGLSQLHVHRDCWWLVSATCAS
jgi:hypothetical protein